MALIRVLTAVAFVGLSTASSAAKVDPLLRAGNSWLVAQQKSQNAVNEIENDRRKMQSEYRDLLREIEGLEAYNRQLNRQIDAQVQEMAELDQSISNATTVDRQILPLMNRMVGALEQFIALDLPFLAEERSERLAFVKDALERVDVSAAEKFRQVLEAYNVELEFGRTIEATTAVENLGDTTLEVDILRVGRIGLYYQTLDGQRSGRWDPKAGAWQDLPATYRNPIRNALKVARKLVAPDLLNLPLPSPENAR